MNSVFSAFKSSKSDGNIQSVKVKKIGPSNSSSYANLRHIREIGSSAKMSSFVGNNDDDNIAPNLRITKCTTTLPVATTSTQSMSSIEQIIPQSAKTYPHQNVCENSRRNIQPESNHVNIDKDVISTENDSRNMGLTAIEQNISSAKTSTTPTTPTTHSHSVAGYTTNIPSNVTPVTDGVVEHNSRDCDKGNTNTTSPSTKTSDSACLSDSSNVLNGTDNSNTKIHASESPQKVNVSNNNNDNSEKQPILSAASNKKLNRHSESTVPSTSNKSTSNRFYKRLSLSGISSNPLPSVHGRSTSNSQNGNCGLGETKRTRISTHQRNLSLDFR